MVGRATEPASALGARRAELRRAWDIDRDAKVDIVGKEQPVALYEQFFSSHRESRINPMLPKAEDAHASAFRQSFHPRYRWNI